MMRRLFKRKYKYHVVYKYQGGAGTIRVSMDVKMKTIEDVDAVEGYIEKKCNLDNVILVNWIRLAS